MPKPMKRLYAPKKKTVAGLFKPDAKLDPSQVLDLRGTRQGLSSDRRRKLRSSGWRHPNTTRGR